MDGQAGDGAPEVLVQARPSLLGVFLTDILSSWPAAPIRQTTAIRGGTSFPFVLLTLLLLALPALLLLVFGQRAQTFPPRRAIG